jgi:SNF family Na+-dependent transporter
MRTLAISSAIENYEAVLDSLQEGCRAQKDTQAVTLIDRCQKTSTLLGLHMALSAFGPLEQVNRVLLLLLQSAYDISVSGMLEAVAVVKEECRNCGRMITHSACFYWFKETLMKWT